MIDGDDRPLAGQLDCDLEIVDFSPLMSKRRSDEIIVGMPAFEPKWPSHFLYRIRFLYARGPLHEPNSYLLGIPAGEKVKPGSP